jgi:hypothetical protein
MHERRTGGRRRAIALLVAIVGLIGGIGVASAPAYAISSDYKWIKNDVSGRCADVINNSSAPGARIQQWDCATRVNQLWLPVSVGNGYFLLQGYRSGLCLRVQDGSTVPGTPIEQQPCSSGLPSQWWQWQVADDLGHLVLTSGLGNLCFALSGVYSGRNGWPIVVNECATTSGQFWRFV